MYRVAYRYLGQKDLAEDATQEAFIKAFSKLSTFDGSSTFGAWLKQIVIHQSIDSLRKRRFDLQVEDVLINETIEEDSWEVSEDITTAQVENCIDELPDKYGVVLKLFLMEGYDHEEISEILNISVNASRTQLHRGKLMLKNILKTQGYERFA